MQATHHSVGGGVVYSGSSSLTDVNQVTNLSPQNSANPKSKKRKILQTWQHLQVMELIIPLKSNCSLLSRLQNSFYAEDLVEMGPAVVNNVISAAIAAAAACLASTNNFINYRGALSPTRVNQIVEKNSEEISNEVEVAKLQAQDATAAVGNCNDVWSQLSKQSDGETKASVKKWLEASVKKRLKAATVASKHAEKLDAIVAAAELAAEAVSQAGRMVSIGDLYWRTDTEEKQIAKDEPQKGPPRVSPREITSALAEPRNLAAAGENLVKTVEQNKSSSQLAEP